MCHSLRCIHDMIYIAFVAGNRKGQREIADPHYLFEREPSIKMYAAEFMMGEKLSKCKDYGRVTSGFHSPYP